MNFYYTYCSSPDTNVLHPIPSPGVTLPQGATLLCDVSIEKQNKTKTTKNTEYTPYVFHSVFLFILVPISTNCTPIQQHPSNMRGKSLPLTVPQESYPISSCFTLKLGCTAIQMQELSFYYPACLQLFQD